MKEYLIVGFGLAGAAFTEYCINGNKTFEVFDSEQDSASKAAAGIYNPIILKRFTYTWQAKEQLHLANMFYKKIEERLNTTFFYPTVFYRKFYSVEEQNDWFVASDKPNLKDYLSTKIGLNTNRAINASLGFGEVFSCGYLNVSKYLQTFKKAIAKSYQKETFNYSNLKLFDDFITYQNKKYKHIIFAEGYSLLLNPFFCNLPLDGAKGEILTIKAPNLKLTQIVKSAIFILPIGNDLYKVGATYNWNDKSNAPTSQAKNELLLDLKQLINCDFEVIDHIAGIRPTVKDRKPLVGTHPKYKNAHVLNGLGTRGVMLAPFLAQQLFFKIENNIPIDSTIDIKRLKNYPSSFYQNEQKD